MPEGHPPPSILELWGASLARGIVATDEYRQSAGDAPYRTLPEQLAANTLPGLRQILDEEPVVNPDAAILTAMQAAAKGASPPLQKKGSKASEDEYKLQLVADLSDPSHPRHQAAVGELWSVALTRLERGSFYRSGESGYTILVARAQLVGEDKDDVRSRFWDKLWPKMIFGDKPLRDPLTLFGYLQREANGFISKQVARYDRMVEKIQRARDEGDPELEQEARARQIDLADANAPRWDDPEATAIANVLREEHLRNLLAAWVAADTHQNRLGFLVYLFDAIRIPNPPGLTYQRGRKDDQIAAVLQAWRDRPDLLEHSLVDPEDGLGLPADLAAEVIAAVSPGFAQAPDRIGERFVTDLLSRFRQAMWPRLQDLYDILADTDEPPDEPEPPTDPATDDPGKGGNRG